MEDTDHSLHADDAPLRLLAAEDTEIPPGHQRIITIPSDVIDRGDVLALPSERWLTRGIAFATGLVRFADGSAHLCAANISQKVLTSKGATLGLFHWL